MDTRPTDIRIVRLLDANLNRAAEGLRVVEDCLRFYWDDAEHSECAKSLRHRLQHLFAPLGNVRRLRSRDTQGDVGTGVTAAGEYTREDISSLLQANLERVKQSLRVLEEASKALGGDQVLPSTTPPEVERLRYELYSLEKSLLSYCGSPVVWTDRVLYVLIDGGKDCSEFATAVDELVSADVDVIQLRDKKLADRPLKDRADQLVRRTRGTRTLAIINDRPDIACAVDADGVHVGQDELSIRDCRRVLGAHAIVGMSTHSPEQIREAIEAGADYLGVGPVFPSGTKHFDATVGLELVREAARRSPVPWFAIGGIDLGSLECVMAAGAQRIAVAGAIANASDRREVVRTIRSRLLCKDEPCTTEPAPASQVAD